MFEDKSKTIVERVAKQDAKINELVDEMNKSVEIVNGYTTDEETRVANEQVRIEYYNQRKEEINVINEQLDNITNTYVKEITTTQLNFSGNSIDNFNKLIIAISKGYKIIVDSFYEIQATAPYVLLNDLNIIGKNKECGFKIIGTVPLFDCNKEFIKIEINNLKILKEDNFGYLFFITNNINIETLFISNCLFIGKITLINYSPQITKDISSCSIKYMKFIGNELINIEPNFCTLIDLRFEKIEICNNKVNNFNRILFNFGNTNNHPQESTLLEQKVYMCVSDNYIECDLNYWGTSGDNLYYCFVLVECNFIEYKRNSVIGMKTTENASMYDLYASCKNVLSENNYWKNNVVFNSNKVNNTLMKAKQNGGIKKYIGNRYIVEENYATQLGMNKNLLFVDLYSIEDSGTEWEIGSNVIEVYELKLSTASKDLKSFNFMNNKIKTKNISSYLMSLRINNNTDYSNSVYNICNNIIFSENAKSFSLLLCTDYSNGLNFLGNVNIENNNINVPVIDSSAVYNLYCNLFNFKGNNISIDSTYSISIDYNVKANYSVIEGNSIINKTGGLRYNRTSIWGNIESKSNRYIMATNNLDYNCNLQILKNSTLYSLDGKYYKYTVKTFKNGVETESYIIFKLYSDGVDNYISFTNSSDVVYDSKISRTSDESNGDGNGQTIKCYGDVLTFKFNNTPTISTIIIDKGFGSCEVQTVLKTFEY